MRRFISKIFGRKGKQSTLTGTQVRGRVNRPILRPVPKPKDLTGKLKESTRNETGSAKRARMVRDSGLKEVESEIAAINAKINRERADGIPLDPADDQKIRNLRARESRLKGDPIY